MYYFVRITQKSNNRHDETKVDLSEKQLNSNFLKPYENAEPILINGKIIEPDDIERIKISRFYYDSKYLIRIIKTEDAQSSVAMIGGPSYEWRAADFAEDVTDKFIKGPPGYKKKKSFNKLKTSSNINLIWDQIKSDYDINKHLFGKKINFIKDDFKRKIIFRDIAQAYHLAQSNFPKPSVILSGGVIEELLRLYLQYKGIKPKGDKFKDYIDACEEKGLLKFGIRKLTDSVRDFRNIVHLKREKTSRYTISKVTAIGSVSSIFTIVNDFSR